MVKHFIFFALTNSSFEFDGDSEIVKLK